jgi:hypothetical protein
VGILSKIDLEKCPVCSESQYKKNYRSCVDDDIQVTTSGSKRSSKVASINDATMEPEDTTIRGSKKLTKDLPWCWYFLSHY